MSRPLRLLSSRATERLLTTLCHGLGAEGIDVRLDSAGGVEVAARLREGEEADLVVLADGALAGLEEDGIVVPGSRIPLFRSVVALAVSERDGQDLRLDTEEDLAAVLRGARAVAYSTGPSGTALLSWIEARGLHGDLAERLVQAPPGTPVAGLVADGTADVGIQQTSELADAAGVRVLGALPGTAAVTSTFAGGVLTASHRPGDAAVVLTRLAAPDVADTVREHHLSPVERPPDPPSSSP